MKASKTAPTPPPGAATRRMSPIETPASAYTDPTDRSMPPEMMTMVAPTAMIAKKLASVAVWISVCELRKLLTDCPVAASMCEPASSDSAISSATMTPTSPNCCERSRRRTNGERRVRGDVESAGVIRESTVVIPPL